MYDVYSCGFDGVIVRAKRVHKQNIFIFAKNLAFKKATSSPGKLMSERAGALWGHFGVTLGSLWGRSGYLWATLGLSLIHI